MQGYLLISIWDIHLSSLSLTELMFGLNTQSKDISKKTKGGQFMANAQ